MVSNVYLENGIIKKVYLPDEEKYINRNIKLHWENEVKALKMLRGKKHFPQVKKILCCGKDKIIWMTYCGDPLTKKNLPKNWEKQCAEIEETLLKCKIYHQDLIGKDNLVYPHHKNIHVRNGVIYLIDFGIWANKQSKGIATITELIKEINGTNKTLIRPNDALRQKR